MPHLPRPAPCLTNLGRHLAVAGRDVMMNHADLVALERSLRGQRVLSVYLDGEVATPGTRTAWRRRLEHALDEVRASLARSPASERAAFERATARLRDCLAPFTGALGSVGWAAFITEDAVHVAEPLSTPVRYVVSWEMGPRVVPMLRAIKVNRGALVCLADARATRLFRYRRGKLERLASLRVIDRADADREVAELVDRVLDRCTRDDWILFGGPPALATAMVAALPPRVARRAMVVPPFPSGAGEFEIAQAAERALFSLRRMYETAIVDAVLPRSKACGWSVANAERTNHALAVNSVEELVLTRRFVERHGELAEHLVRDAFDQGAMVEEVYGTAAERLDAVGGVGALLRAGYRTPALGIPVVRDTAAEDTGPRLPLARTPELTPRPS